MLGRRTASQIAVSSAAFVVVALEVDLHLLSRHQTNLTVSRANSAPRMPPYQWNPGGKASKRQSSGCVRLLSSRPCSRRRQRRGPEHVRGDIQTIVVTFIFTAPHGIRLRRSLFGTVMPTAAAVRHIDSIAATHAADGRCPFGSGKTAACRLMCPDAREYYC
jgi:hypothetical protein